MAKTLRKKFDLITLAIKQKLIGCEIVMNDDTSLEISDFYIDYPTSEIHVEFTDGTDSSFNLNEKFVVKLDHNYKNVKAKKKRKKKKKS
jgi:hypothetical protein